MPSLLVKNVSPRLHEALKSRAKRHLRSINNEVIACLQEVIVHDELDPMLRLERVRGVRSVFRQPVPACEVDAMIRSGRK